MLLVIAPLPIAFLLFQSRFIFMHSGLGDWIVPGTAVSPTNPPTSLKSQRYPIS
jgi:hypothetical protein